MRKILQQVMLTKLDKLNKLFLRIPTKNNGNEKKRS